MNIHQITRINQRNSTADDGPKGNLVVYYVTTGSRLNKGEIKPEIDFYFKNRLNEVS